MPYRSAHHALICCFVDHARPGHSGWQDLHDPKSRDDIKLDLRGELETAAMQSTFRSGLSGTDEICGEAAMVWKHLVRMGDTRASTLIIKTCPPRMPSKLDPQATLPHWAFETALRWLVDESAQVVTGLSHYRARRDAIRMCLGGKLKSSMTADKCDVSTRTVDRLVGRVKSWIGPIEAQAWAEMQDRLESAGLIEREMVGCTG